MKAIHANKKQALQQIFGFDEFRPLQEEVVDKILNHQDILLTLPTGGGKSLCYQLPALLMDGLVVVISPLLALMQDQVRGLEAKGIKAAMLSSMQSIKELQQIESSLNSDLIKILFIAPERLQNNLFLQKLINLKIAFFAIDEAHCVSEWGHEFRADYRELGLLKREFPKVGIAAFTATATKKVEKDIIHQLQFSQNNIIRGSIYRDNLFISVVHRLTNGQQQLLSFLESRKNQQGIIYTLSRKSTESLADFLRQNNFKANAYHAGLSTKDRTQAFNSFVNDDVDIMVATIAFGMGIDKSNIRFVVHMSLPKTMEAYYQEMGRAGRDGLPADVMLLFSTGDIGMLSNFINDIEDENYRKLAYEKLNLMKKYAYQEGCRHQALSQYFDDNMQECATQCDNCLNPDKAREDISELAKMFLSAVYRARQNFGQLHIIDILIGSKNQKIISNNHQELSVYNIGASTSKAKWRIVGDRLLEIGALILGEFNVLKLTDFAMQILKSEKEVDIRSIHLKQQQAIATPKNKANTYQVDEEIFNQLRSLRRQIASESNLPAYIVFDDKALTEMAYFMPDNKEKFLQINGVGEIKFQKYGKQFLELLQELRNPDFAEPIKDTPIKTTGKLHKTYALTLDLIAKNATIVEICEQRELDLSIILKHINKLFDEHRISSTQKQQLFNQVPINTEINNWLLQGLELDSVDNLHNHLAIFKQLNQ